MWRIIKRHLHPNYTFPTQIDSKLVAESTRVSHKVYKYLDQNMLIRQNDYLISVARIFPFILHTKIYRSLLGQAKTEEPTSKYHLNREAWQKFDKILESEVFSLEHFDLAYRMANPLFCLEEIDALNHCDVTSAYKHLENIGNKHIFQIIIDNTKLNELTNDETKFNSENLKEKNEKIVNFSVFGSNVAGFQLMTHDTVQELAYNLKPITNEYIVDVAESKLFNNFPDFGDHNVGMDRQVNITIPKPNLNNSPSNQKVTLGIKLVGGDITNVETTSYIAKYSRIEIYISFFYQRFLFGPTFIESIQENSIAVSNNSLFVGDRLIAINQTNIEGQSLVMVNNLIEDSINSGLDSISFLVRYDPIELKVNNYLTQFNAEKYTTFNRAVKFDSILRRKKARTRGRMAPKDILYRL